MDTITVIGLGITAFATVFGSGFVQFMIQRKDKREDRLGDLEKNIDKRLDDLEDRLKTGLDEREQKGAERFNIHEDKYDELRRAILSLTDDAKERSRIQSAMAQSIMAMTHDKIVHLGKSYQRRGAITLAEKNNLTMLYTPYHNDLGGNSDGEGYYNFCMCLPVITDEEAMEMDAKNRQELFRQING